jgi:hypothetical protein
MEILAVSGDRERLPVPSTVMELDSSPLVVCTDGTVWQAARIKLNTIKKGMVFLRCFIRLLWFRLAVVRNVIWFGFHG